MTDSFTNDGGNEVGRGRGTWRRGTVTGPNPGLGAKAEHGGPPRRTSDAGDRLGTGDLPEFKY